MSQLWKSRDHAAVTALWLGLVVLIAGCGDDVTTAPPTVAGQPGGGDSGEADPPPPPVDDSDPPPPPVDVEPDPPPPPPSEGDPKPVTPDRIRPRDPKPKRPVVPAPTPDKAFRIVTEAGVKRAVVAAGVVIDKSLLAALADAGGFDRIDVVETGAPLLKVVPLLRRFPQVSTRFAGGEWTLGTITLEGEATSADLKAAASMREIRHLNLEDSQLGDAELVDLRKMVGLESLRLPVQAGDGTVRSLVPLRRLRDLSLESTQVTAAGLATLPRSLESLNLAGTTLGDDVAAHVRRLPGLKRLWLDETTIGDATLAAISTRTTIEVLGLTGTAITSAGLKHLAGLEHLHALYLGETAIDDASVGGLVAMSQLKVLDVTSTGLSVGARQTLVGALKNCEVQIDKDALVQALEDTTGRMEPALLKIARVKRDTRGQVTALNIHDEKFSDIGMAMLPRFTSLKQLSVEGTLITDAGLKHLTAMTQLEELWLGDTVVSDAGLDAIRTLRALRQLHLQGTRTTVSGVLHLWPALPRVTMSFPGGRLAPGSLALDRKAGSLELIPLAGITGLKYLQLEGVRPGDAGLEHIAGLVELETLKLRRAGIHGPGLVHLHNMGALQVLDLSGNPLDDVTGDSIAAWVELREMLLEHTNLSSLESISTSGRVALKRLSLAGSPIGDEQLQPVAQLANLELLNLSGCPVTGAGVAACVTKLPMLQAVALSGTAIGDEGVSRLAACSSLRVLRLSDSPVTATGISALSSLPRLSRLDLSGCDVDSKMLEAAGRLAGLKHLDLRRTSLSASLLVAWREKHADCEVVHHPDPLLEALASGNDNKPASLSAAVQRVAVVGQSGSGVSVTVTDADLTDAGLARLVQLDGLSRLVLNGVGITDAGVSGMEMAGDLRALDLSRTAITDHVASNLARLNQLTELSLADTEFSDRGLSRLSGLDKLQSLDLGGLGVSAEGLTAAFPRLPSLRHVNLSETWIVNADLRVLGTVKGLESLAVRDTVISDKGVPAISSLKSLKRLWIERTRITERGAETLRKALPECEIFGP